MLHRRILWQMVTAETKVKCPVSKIIFTVIVGTQAVYQNKLTEGSIQKVSKIWLRHAGKTAGWKTNSQVMKVKQTLCRYRPSGLLHSTLTNLFQSWTLQNEPIINKWVGNKWGKWAGKCN